MSKKLGIPKDYNAISLYFHTFSVVLYATGTDLLYVGINCSTQKHTQLLIINPHYN